MLKVVSNTTPVISLLKLNKLEILKDLYGQIRIPLAVYREIETGKSKGYYQDLLQVDWILISKVANRQIVTSFPDLDAGEAEAIVLALETGADLIILDERIGRFHAKHEGLNVTGTIGILIKAKKQGLIKEVKPLLTELTEKEVWISDKLKREILNQVGEK